MRGRVVREKTTVAFFHEQLLAAMNHQKVSASAFTEFYLVNLLAAFVGRMCLPGREPGFDETPLALLYARALEVSGWERAARLRVTADTALFVSGFFPDSLPRGDRDLGYYASLGEQAYARLGRDHERQASAATGVFTELASRFRDFVDLLTEIGEKTRLTTPASLVRLYERWRRTGSRRSAKLLVEQGLTPVFADSGLRH